MGSTKPFLVYVLEDPRTEEIRYVGITGGLLSRRLSAHIGSARNNVQRHVSRWIRGLPCKPRITAIETHATHAELLDAESFYIAYFRSLGFHLTNLTEGGEGTVGWVSNKRGTRLSTAQKKKISDTLTGHSYNKGIPKSREHRAKLSAAKKGKQKPLEARQRQAATMRARGHKPPSWTGKHHSQKTRTKMIQSAQTPARPVQETTTGKIYPSIKAAARDLNLPQPEVSRVLSGYGGRKSVKGFRFIAAPCEK